MLARRACIACASKKRKCDRELPSCTPCRRIGAHCSYRANNCIVIITPPSTEEHGHDAGLGSRYRAQRVCAGCKERKKSCDKRVPSCSRCNYLGVKCTYRWVHHDGAIVPLPEPSARPALLDSQFTQPAYPVPARDEFALLLDFFQYRMGVTSLSVDPQSLAFHMRTTWLQHALSDPCLFHTVLFYASSRLDSRETGRPGTITLHHQTQAVTRINRRLASGNVELDDSLIASVALLAMHACVVHDPSAMEIHIRGMMSMVQAKGGLKNLGFAGSLIDMVYMAKFFSTALVAADTLDIETASSCPPPAPLIASIIHRAQLNSVKLGRASPVLPLFQEIHRASPSLHDFRTGRRHLSEWRGAHNSHIIAQNTPPPTHDDTVYAACKAATSIFWSLVDGSSLVQDGLLFSLYLDLKQALAATDLAQWTCFSQEALIWVCAVGAAVSQAAVESWWFIMRAGAVVMGTKLSRGSVMEESWFAFCSLRELYGKRIGESSWLEGETTSI